MGLGRVGAVDFQRQGIAGGDEPLAAAIDMAPAFEMRALGVFLCEEVAVELVVGGVGAGADEMRLAALMKLGLLGGDAAAGAGEDQHFLPPCSVFIKTLETIFVGFLEFKFGIFFSKMSFC